MKKILLYIFFLCVSTIVNAQEPLKLSNVIQAEGKNATEISEIVRRWVAVTYKHPGPVTKYDDGSMEIILKTFFYVSPKSFSTSFLEGNVDYSLDFQFRDGRMKITMSDFYHKTSKLKGGHSLGIVFDKELSKELYKEYKLGNISYTKGMYEDVMKLVRVKAIQELDNISQLIKKAITENKEKEKEDW